MTTLTIEGSRKQSHFSPRTALLALVLGSTLSFSGPVGNHDYEGACPDIRTVTSMKIGEVLHRVAVDRCSGNLLFSSQTK